MSKQSPIPKSPNPQTLMSTSPRQKSGTGSQKTASPRVKSAKSKSPQSRQSLSPKSKQSRSASKNRPTSSVKHEEKIDETVQPVTASSDEAAFNNIPVADLDTQKTIVTDEEPEEPLVCVLCVENKLNEQN